MRLKNWLLAGTSLTLMSVAPLHVAAQDAPPELPQACIDAGFTTLEDCIAAQPAEGAAPEASPPAEEPAAEPPVEEQPAEEPAPVEEPVVEPAPEEAPPPVEEPAPEPQPEPAPVVEAAPEPAPAPEPEAAPVEEPAMQVEQAPAPEVAPAPEAAPAEQPPEQTPPAEPAPAEPAPAEVAPAPEPAPVAEPAADQPDYAGLLAAQVDAYNAAIADLMAGGDPADAQARLESARAEIARLCGEAGQGDVDACLANYGLSLPAVPNLGQPAPAPEAAPAPAPEAAPVPAPEQPAAEAPLPDPNAPVTEQPTVTVDGQPAEVLEELPEGITQEQVAPVLDSAKDVEAAPPAEGQPADAPAAVEAQPAVAPVAPPESDEAAQSEEIRTFAATPMMSLAEEQGEEVTATDNSTVNQTVVNNYITNITNNVTNTTTNNTTNNIGQQNNVTIVEQVPVQEANSADLVTQVILQIGTQLVVNSIGQDTDRFYNPQQDEVYYDRLPGDRVRETITRPDGSQVVTVRNRNGDILRRSRITPDGREIVLAYFDDRYDDDLLVWRDPGADLPPLQLNIPVRDYVLDASYADEDELEVFFRQPPVEQVTRLYSIDEVKRSARIRDTVRRLEVGNLTFDTGAATINRDQVGSLSAVASAMLDLLEVNPAETFLIEGHTDAVGSDASNLRLSDLRAATVARILTDFYGVPPENLATQGYGERYLKIRTEADERENRRVTIRRITPLITVASNG